MGDYAATDPMIYRSPRTGPFAQGARGLRINGQTGNPSCKPHQAAPRPPHPGRKLLSGRARGGRASGWADRARFGRMHRPPTRLCAPWRASTGAQK